MRARYLSKVLLLTSFFLHGTAYAAPTLEGAWRLQRVNIPSAEDSTPSGILNVKELYTPDGRLCFVAPTKSLDSNTPCFPYSIEGTTRTIRMPGRSPIQAQISFPDDETLIVRQRAGDTWTYRRLPFSDAVNVRSEAWSVEELEHGDGKPIVYDDQSYTSLPPPERVIGAWEEIARCGVRPVEAPPYGFYNNLWIFSANEIVHITRLGRTSERRAPRPYSIVNGELKVEELSLAASFNEWGHLVLAEGGRTIFLKRVLAQANQADVIPKLRIILLSWKGKECDL